MPQLSFGIVSPLRIILLILSAGILSYYSFSGSKRVFHTIESGFLKSDDIYRYSEAEKALRSGRKYLTIVKWSNERGDGAKKVLLFRPPDYVSYGKFEYFDYQDPAVAPLFRLMSKDQLSDLLRTLGITHIISPDYSFSEIYDSRLGALLADPAYASLEQDYDGYREFRLLPRRPEPPSDPAVPLLSAVGGQVLNPEAVQAAEIWTPVIAVPETGDPTAAIDLNRTYVFRTLLSGRGHASVGIEILSGPESEQVQQTLELWSGLLHGTPRQIEIQFIPRLGQISGLVPVVDRVVASPYFRQLHGSDLDVLGWELLEVVGSAEAEAAKLYSDNIRLLRDGWRFSGNKRSRTLVEAGLTEDGDIHFPDAMHSGISLVSPLYTVVTEDDGKPGLEPVPTEPAELELSFVAHGRGELEIGFVLHCPSGHEIALPLGSGALSLGNTPRDFTLRQPLPCHPVSLQVEASKSGEPGTVPEFQISELVLSLRVLRDGRPMALAPLVREDAE